MKTSRSDLAGLVAEQQEALASGKANFQAADKLGRRIARRIKGARRRTVSFIPGTAYKLINNPRMLREKHLLFGHGAVREWDIEPMNLTEQAQAAAQREEISDN